MFCIYLMQDWFAFSGAGSEFSFTLSGEAYFPNIFPPRAEDNYGYCQVSVNNCNFLWTWRCRFKVRDFGENRNSAIQIISISYYLVSLLFSQEVQFNTTFYTLPVVLVSVQHIYNPQVSTKSLISLQNNIISAWVEVHWALHLYVCLIFCCFLAFGLWSLCRRLASHPWRLALKTWAE